MSDRDGSVAIVERVRCEWAGDDPRMIEYHDVEWGTPSRDDVHLFEMLILEGAQAGLSWQTILNKREAYRLAFAGFDLDTVARFRQARIEKLMADPGIVRNRAKIESTVANAKAAVLVRKEERSLSDYLWSFVRGKPIINRPRSLVDIPSETDESRAMSKALKQRGFRFVGPTICYAFMEAVGMAFDHTVRCFRYEEFTSRRR
jgi:DNA-3-methyladenine glycosylase I